MVSKLNAFLSSGSQNALLDFQKLGVKVWDIVRRICAICQYNCAKNGKGLKIGTKEADTI